ncbi:hypothetical protein [Gordonia sp. MP11Mi]|uniref:hypothetical protein n=1 Tax=Gordonia sp. MP11Mi TaxID=3022769 RepID=UPI003B2237AB
MSETTMPAAHRTMTAMRGYGFEVDRILQLSRQVFVVNPIACPIHFMLIDPLIRGVPRHRLQG